MTHATDAELWRRASSGESEAFGLLFERHADALYSFCFRRTADWALAEDLTSVVFLEAWRRRRDVVLAGESARPWLLGVATNVIRHRRRTQIRHRAALERLPLEPDADFAGDADDRVDDERRMRAALRLVGRLPRREQEVFALCAWADLTYEEAAVALAVPVGRVRSPAPEGLHEEMFTLVGDGLRETNATPEQRAALYEVAARLPGVELVGRVTDPAGRSGTAVAMAQEEDGVRHTLVFDPETSELLAEQQVALADNAFGYAEGAVVGYATYVAGGIVDRVGQRP